EVDKMTNWTNKWVVMLLLGIIIQVIAYAMIWLFDIYATAFSNEYGFSVFLIGMLSLVVQIGGFYTIMSKTKDADPAIYGQGRPFKHKLREEDEEEATRKPTFDGSDQSAYE
ncbi:MAG: hypothetical protein RTU92_09015, partial [Candidatus Thorarchaeota archaeon]